MSTRRAAALVMVVALGCVPAACGGSSGSSSATTSGPAVSDSDAQAIGKADLAVFSSANASSYIVRHPDNVRRAEQILKPLIVAKALQVKPTDQLAGGLVTDLIDQLDNITPGLTTGVGGEERLDGPVVHRLLVFGLKDPAEVFRPKAASGVTQLERLLHGLTANTRRQPHGRGPSPDRPRAGDAGRADHEPLLAGPLQTAPQPSRLARLAAHPARSAEAAPGARTPPTAQRRRETANATAILTGDPARRPRPASRTAVTGL